MARRLALLLGRGGRGHSTVVDGHEGHVRGPGSAGLEFNASAALLTFASPACARTGNNAGSSTLGGYWHAQPIHTPAWITPDNWPLATSHPPQGTGWKQFACCASFRSPNPLPPPPAWPPQVVYEARKKVRANERAAREARRLSEPKEVRVGCHIAENDLNVKMDRVGGLWAWGGRESGWLATCG